MLQEQFVTNAWRGKISTDYGNYCLENALTNPNYDVIAIRAQDGGHYYFMAL